MKEILMEREKEEIQTTLKRLDEEEQKKETKRRKRHFCYRIIDRNVEGVEHDEYELENGYKWIIPTYIKDELERQNEYDEDVLSTYIDFSRDDSERGVYEYDEDEYCQGIVDPEYRNDCCEEDDEYYDDED